MRAGFAAVASAGLAAAVAGWAATRVPWVPTAVLAWAVYGAWVALCWPDIVAAAAAVRLPRLPSRRSAATSAGATMAP